MPAKKNPKKAELIKALKLIASGRFGHNECVVMAVNALKKSN